ncbi:unnamed protein product [Phyllotreta striolata]|uniref:DNA polymerase n=1 Tax=Phyllotreta striolata TaxID=444603 RepID=A0A9N9TU60_PHYSR|nr:unnamed protein product [Phyllotreta striolata]
MEDSPLEGRSSKRSKTFKAKASEKFKQFKRGVKNKYEVGEVENVYEVVEEKQYIKEVMSRCDDDWIVGDSSGYIEDGRDIFDDDLDVESIAQASTKGKGVKRKHKNVSENAGKGKLQQMFSTMPTKQKTAAKVDDDEMLSEILDEIGTGTANKPTVEKPKIDQYSTLAINISAKNYMKNLSQPVKKRAVEKKVQKIQPSVPKRFENLKEKLPEPVKIQAKENEKIDPDKVIEKETMDLDKNTEEEKLDLDTSHFDDGLDETLLEEFNEDLNNTASESQITESEMIGDDFAGDFDTTQIDEIEEQINLASEQLINDIQAEVETEWQYFNNANESFKIATGSEDAESSSAIPADTPFVKVDGKNVFRFFWWDAYVDPQHQQGTVFLFGKTYCETSKKYESCCVAVKNIERTLFVLPRPFELDENGKPTDKPVTFKTVHDEFNNRILKRTGITSFKSRLITKKYAFDANIPAESEYLEVRYPASFPRILCNEDRQHDDDESTDNDDLGYGTFSKIFGIKTNFLESLFLERKIKGPCWIDVSDPEAAANPMSFCKFEVNCLKPNNLKITPFEKPVPPPPLVVATINMRNCINRASSNHEIVMLSCLVQNRYAVNKPPPEPAFQHHFCVFSCPGGQVLPLNLYDTLQNYKITKVLKTDNEKAMLNCFINNIVQIDPDLIVGHNLQGYQTAILADRLLKLNCRAFNRLGRLKKRATQAKQLERTLFLGRLVCDVKISAKELIKSRSYDLDTLCQVVLKLKENQRVDLEPEDVFKMFKTSQDLIKLISFTMQDSGYIMKMMYNLNIVPLALQITNIAGNVMSRTLMGGRSERNEFLLLHAFHEKGYILPDKVYRSNENESKGSSKKKPTYSGGLVLEPKVGFYDKLILLMDFNSLYPSIIQEYNICFTTLPVMDSDENLVLPDSNLPPGILPTEIRKLVESRRQVKSLMKKPDISKELKLQYDIRQMALKLTANSMYGCLGFGHSRFYARNLAALITQKGREILVNTKDLIEKMCLDVVYGDTDSLMINTNVLDYDQVFKVGVKIKQEVNKLYKQVELDIDGVFKYLLLLKKKKYAAVTLTKSLSGELVATKEYKGLDIVRRDWSQLSSETGKLVLEHLLSDQSSDEKIKNIYDHLATIKSDLIEGKIPIPLLVITKQLNKAPHMYTDKNSMPHVQVALRYNQKSRDHFRMGDTVPYVICTDNTGNGPMQRAYHLDELKGNPDLKIDYDYYLEQQIHPVIARICEPIEGLDAYQLAECLGANLKRVKRPKPQGGNENIQGENVVKAEVKFKNAEKFTFVCYICKHQNVVGEPLMNNIPFLETCQNPECQSKPIDYLPSVQNQLYRSIRSHITKYYKKVLTCEDPSCPNAPRRLPLKFLKKRPVCNMCCNAVMYKVYTEFHLYNQLAYYRYMFDLSKLKHKPLMDGETESGYRTLQDTVDKFMNQSEYSLINLSEVFGQLGWFGASEKVTVEQPSNGVDFNEEGVEDAYDE